MTKTKTQVREEAVQFIDNMRRVTEADKAFATAMRASIESHQALLQAVEARASINEGFINILEDALENEVCLTCGQPVGWQETVSLFQSPKVGKA